MRVITLLCLLVLWCYGAVLGQNCPITADINTRDASCFDSEDGLIEVRNIRGGTAPYRIDLYEVVGSGVGALLKSQPEQSPVNVFSMLKGEIGGKYYYIEIVDANNVFCSRIDSRFLKKIEKPRQLEVIDLLSQCSTCTKPFTVSCFGARDGIITVRNPNAGQLGNITIDFTLMDQNLSIIQTKRLPQDAHPLDPIAVSFTGLAGEKNQGSTKPGKRYFVRTVYNNPTSGLTCDNIEQLPISAIYVEEPDPVSFDLSQVAPASCAGRGDGIIDLRLTGGTEFPNGTPVSLSDRYTYLWNNGEITEDLVQVRPGRYDIVVKDAHNCSYRTTFTVAEPKPLQVTSVSVHNISCNGSSAATRDGMVTIAAKGGFSGTPFQPASKRIRVFRRELSGGWIEVPTQNNITKAIYNVDTTYKFVLGDIASNPNATIVPSVDLIPGTYKYEIYEYESNPEYNLALRQLKNPAFQSEACSVSGQFVIGEPTPITVKAFVSPLDCNFDENAGDNIYVYQNGSQVSYTTTAIGGLTPVHVYRNDQANRVGRIDLVVTGGIPYNIGGKNEYKFHWEHKFVPAQAYWNENLTPGPGQLSEPQNRLNLMAGTYRVTVEDANGCKSVLEIPVTEGNLLTLSTSMVPPACHNAANGSITAQPAGGTGNFRYQWSRVVTVDPPVNPLENEFLYDESSATLANLQQGHYRVRVRDEKGCQLTRDVRIDEVDPIQIIFEEIKHVRCYNTVASEERGQIRVRIEGGSGIPYYTRLENVAANWIPSENQNIFHYSNLTAGTYTLFVRDGRGCIKDVVVKIDQPTPIVPSLQIKQKACKGGADNGHIIASATGGTPYNTLPPIDDHYLYSWYKKIGNTFTLIHSEVNATSRITRLGVGEYRLEITDKAGCKIQTAPLFINEPPTPLHVDIQELQAIQCNGGKNGVLRALPVGGRTPYAYYWQNVDFPGDTAWLSSRDIDSLRAGNYTLTVRDGGDCFFIANYTLSQPRKIVVTATATAPSMNCQPNGAIAFDVTAPRSPFAMEASLAPAPESINFRAPAPFMLNSEGQASGLYFEGLPAGYYTITVKDANGCKGEVSVPIVPGGDSFGIQNLEILTDSITCAERNDGKALVRTVIGGVSGYRIEDYTYEIRPAWVGNITFAKNTPPNNNQFTGLADGAYDIRVSYEYPRGSGSVCSYIKRVQIGEPEHLSVKVDTLIDVACYNQKTGEIRVSGTGGNGGYQYEWSNGVRSNVNSGLQYGTYYLTVRDRKGCSVTVNNLNVKRPSEPLTASLATDEVSPKFKLNVSGCHGNEDGQLITIIKGGWGPYTVEWSSGRKAEGVTMDTLKAIGVGTYTYKVIDAKGCEVTSNPTNIVVADPLKISDLKTIASATCGTSTGEVHFGVKGGTGPFEYTIHHSDGAVISRGLADANNNVIIKNVKGNTLLAPSYIVTLKDLRGCTDTIRGVVVKNPPLPVVNAQMLEASKKNVTCYGGSNGSVTGYADVDQRACPGCVFTWTSNGRLVSTTATASGLKTGRYQLIVTDPVTNCSSLPYFVSIDEPGQFDLSVVTIKKTDVRCFGESNGAVSVTLPASAGTRPYSYTWFSGTNILQEGAKDQLSGLRPGVYRISITDANQCGPIETSVTIIEYPRIAYSIDSLRSRIRLACNGDKNGTIVFSILGGNPPYKNRQWQKLGDPTFNPADHGLIEIDNRVSLNALPAGQYTYSLYDANDCFYSETIPVNEPAALSVTQTVRNIGCSGSAFGGVTFTINGGQPPYAYSIPGMSAGTSVDGRNISVSNLPEGLFSLLVFDKNNCSYSTPLQIQKQTMQAQVFNACTGQTNGRIVLTTQNGRPNYVYNWSGTSSGQFADPSGKNTYTIAGLAPGIYNVWASDANQCITLMNNIVVNQVAEPVIITDAYTVRRSGMMYDISCNGGSDGEAMVEFKGGEPPYSVVWATVAETTTTNSFKAKHTGISVSMFGNYVTILDKNGCNATRSFVITQPPLPLSIRPEVLLPTECTKTNGAISLNITGGVPGYTVRWANGQTGLSLTGIGEGEHIVVVSDANGCVKEERIAVQIPRAKATLEAGSNLNLRCKGTSEGILSITVTEGLPPYNYLWSKGTRVVGTTQDLVGLSAGRYTLRVLDARNCRQVFTYDIQEPAIGIEATADITKSECNLSPATGTGSIAIRISGTNNPTLTWAGPFGFLSTAATISNLPFGVYTATVIGTVADGNTCKRDFPFFVDLNTDLRIVKDRLDSIRCYNQATGGISIIPVGGTPQYLINWQDGPVTAARTGLSAGTYTVTVTDSRGCFRRDTTQLLNPELLTVVVDAYTDVLCKGGSNGKIDVSARGGLAPYQYAWKNAQNNTWATEDLSNLPAGKYDLTVTDTRGCVATIWQTIAEPVEGITATTEAFPAKCNDLATGRAEVTITGGTPGYTYQWSNGKNTKDLNNVVPGRYILTVTDTKGCTTTDTALITLQQYPLPQLRIEGDTVLCDGGSVVMLVNNANAYPGDAIYRWTNGTATVSATFKDTLGVYAHKVTVTLPSCNIKLDSRSVRVTVNPKPALPVVIIDQEAGTLSSSAAGIFYRWFKGTVKIDGATGREFRPTESGEYSVEVENQFGCKTRSASVQYVTGVEEGLQALAGISIYPNPTSGQLTIESANRLEGKVQVMVLNNLGQVVHEANFENLAQARGLNLEKLSAGIYTVSIWNASGRFQTKVLKN